MKLAGIRCQSAAYHSVCAGGFPSRPARAGAIWNTARGFGGEFTWRGGAGSFPGWLSGRSKGKYMASRRMLAASRVDRNSENRHEARRAPISRAGNFAVKSGPHPWSENGSIDLIAISHTLKRRRRTTRLLRQKCRRRISGDIQSSLDGRVAADGLRPVYRAGNRPAAGGYLPPRGYRRRIPGDASPIC